jgi:hypothetical protein
MWSDQQRPLTSKGLKVVTALSLTLWLLTALFFGYINLRSAQCPETATGLGRCGIFGLLVPLLMLLAISVGDSAFAALTALGVALDAQDWGSAACFGVLLAATVFATYALLQVGHPGHPVVTAIYGFPPDGLGLHPLAYYGSAALVVLLPVLVLPYALTRGHARRMSAVAGLMLVLVFWLALRLAG